MITILGAGLAGLSAAYHLKGDYLVLERESSVGGLCRSVDIGGYVFDYAPHILFTRDEYAKNLFFSLLGDNVHTQERQAYIYMEDTFVKYPFEVNLHPLPKRIIEECIQGVIEKKEFEPRNFLEWIQTTFGEGIAKHYMVPYNQKIWKYPLAKMNTEWVAGRIPSPSADEMRKGVKGEVNKDYGPNAMFWYPKYGGIGALANEFKEGLNVSLNSDAVEIKTTADGVKTIYTQDGKTKDVVSEKVLSSLPLPELIKSLDDVPTEVVKAADSLVYNSIVCVNVGVKRPNIINKHWLYFPEKDLIFNRISFPMNFSPYTTPEGRSSVLVEVTYRGDPLDQDETRDTVLQDLVKANIIRDDDEVEVSDTADFKYAYVIYDLHHTENVKIIRDFLDSINIIPIGRFGEWEYYNMDKAILSGRRAAEKLNEGKP
ncbi:MAG: FAD-dependent oxidoreductase [Candidatus Bathyarchaeota archaeon]|nr:FAD-dependent oxidoreductase [Candidatus Bathyarchaeota archaeon]